MPIQDNGANATSIAICYLMLISGYIFSQGFLDYTSLIITCISLIALLTYKAKRVNFSTNKNYNTLNLVLSFILIFSTSLSIYFPKSLYERQNFLRDFQFDIYLLAFFASLFILVKMGKELKGVLIAILFFVPILSQTLVIINSPNPKIDVYDILQTSSLEITKLKNPYQLTFGENYLYPGKPSPYYSYFPLSFIFLIPSRVFFGDVRFTLVFANIIVAAIMYLLLKKTNFKNTSILVPLIYLYNPLGTLIVEQSWLEPLLICMFALFGYFLIHKKKQLIAFLVASLIVGIKQDMMFLVPFIIRFRKIHFKKIILSFLPVVLIISIFFFLSPKDFLNDTFIEPITRESRLNSLSIPTLLTELTRIDFKLIRIIPIILLLFLLKKPFIRLSELLTSFIIFFLSYLLFSTNSFLNAYYLASSLLLLNIVLLLHEKPAI